MNNHKNVIDEIKQLRWERLSASELQVLTILAAYAAREFAESLRIALRLYPESSELREMASGELETSNLQFGDYSQPGDHANFLWHFINKHNLTELHPEAVRAGETYLAKVRELPDEIRAMSIISRERELPQIFERILEARDWSMPILEAFHHYLKEHIRLDSMEGGHADLLSSFIVTNEITVFYKARLDMYRCISTLFA